MSDHPPDTLAGIAQQLLALADDLQQGRLRIGSSSVSVGDPIFLKSKQKVTEGKAYFTLSFQVPILATTTEGQAAVKPKPTPHPPRGNFGDRPPEGKRIKKEMATLWKEVVRGLADGKAPAAALARRLLNAGQEYRLFAESAWEADWLACCDTLRDALDTAKKGDLDAARRLAEEVNQQIKTCHRQYK